MTEEPMDPRESNSIPLDQQISSIKDSVERTLAALEDQSLPTDQSKTLKQITDNVINLNMICDEIKSIENERNILIALTHISAKLNSSISTHQVLETIMDSLIQITGAERAFLMVNDTDNNLNVRVGRNWSQENVHDDDMKISSSVAKQVVSSGKAILTSNATEDPRFSNQASVHTQHLRSILCAPLTLKGKTIGIVYADNRIREGLFTNTQLKLLSSFTDQAAIALENANLFDGLKEANRQLESSYDSTLEGWAKALELRDDETEGHTQRVTELTLTLAKEIGVEEQALEHIRRGALLHDIGKMAIPDSVLLNTQTLSDDEMKVMHTHPLLAKKMLAPIEFLAPSLDIPLYHHERWDGTGYPEGLARENIPLAARIFAIVDVYDALTSKRRYRTSIPKDEVLQMLQDASGSHFDPEVVLAFLKII